MRHLKKGRKLNRKRNHRDAMFNNMLESFFQYESIRTTEAKAKELRSLSEKMITRAKQNTLHSKRLVLKRLHNRDIVAKLFDDIAPRYQEVHGGYTRILKIGRRQGDGARLSLLELVDVEEARDMKQRKASTQKKPAKAPATRASSEKKPPPDSKAKASVKAEASAKAETSAKPATSAKKKPGAAKSTNRKGEAVQTGARASQTKAKAPAGASTKKGSGTKAKAATPKTASSKKGVEEKAESTAEKKAKTASAGKQPTKTQSKPEKPDAKGSA